MESSCKVDLAACALLILITTVKADEDKPCAARQIPGQSVVCVCNNTYCDEITRDPPADQRYVAYTSSEAGLRFKKSVGELRSSYVWSESCFHTLELNPKTTYREIEGFGGAITDAVGFHWAALSASLQTSFVNSYFSKKGLEYNMMRVPIGGCDFSTHDYAYNELPLDDAKLTNFSLSPEDFQIKIPLIKLMSAAATAPVHVVASTWSPPAWMKTNNKPTGLSAVKPEYYQTYADFHMKFIREYKKNGIDIWAVTTTNEPTESKQSFTRYQTLGWIPEALGKWIVENLGPSFRNSKDLNYVKILAIDDQRFTIPLFFNKMIEAYPRAIEFIDGVALHYYGDLVTSVDNLKMITEVYPSKLVINTEACEGYMEWQESVSLGSWQRAKTYINSILTDLNYDVVGWIDWNMCLDKQGGPNWAENFVDSPVIVLIEAQEFVKQPMFYAMGHFSKWIPRGSVRIDVKEYKIALETALQTVAFLTPRNTVVLVVHNEDDARQVRVQLENSYAVLALERSSITTVELAYSP